MNIDIPCAIFVATMDCVSAAASLKKLLVAHGQAEKQVSALGKWFIMANEIKSTFQTHLFQQNKSSETS